MGSNGTPMVNRDAARHDRKQIGLLTWREFDVLDLAATIAPQPLTPHIVAKRVCGSGNADTGYQVLRRMSRTGIELLSAHRPSALERTGGPLSNAEKHWRPTPLALELYAEALARIDHHNEARTA